MEINNDYKKITEALKYPTGKVQVVIDTDAYNEVDDQFAIAWALKSTERMDVQAVYAAPFCSKAIQKIIPVPDEVIQTFAHYAGTPAEGMEKSYREILNLFGLMGENPEGRVFRGSEQYLGEDEQPVKSDAACDLVKRAMNMPAGERLYVLAIGAITNVASAILMEPKIMDRIVVVWLGGQPLHFKSAVEFNLMQDVAASKLMFDCGVPLVLIPCMTVASHLTLTKPELDTCLIGKSRIGTYLGKIVYEMFSDAAIPTSDRTLKLYLGGMDDLPMEVTNLFTVKSIAWSRIVWDISTVGHLINPNWCATTLVPSPVLNDDMSWGAAPGRHPIRVCHYVSRDQIFGDLFAKLM